VANVNHVARAETARANSVQTVTVHALRGQV
jgi:hypothetical protein